MYVLLFGGLLIFGVYLVMNGMARRRRGRLWLGVLIGLSTVTLIFLMTFWAEMLWYDALGYGSRFWTFVWGRLGVTIAGAIAAGLVAYLLVARAGAHLRRRVAFVAATGGVVWGLFAWQLVLLYLNRVTTNVADPMLGLDVGFYLFTLPLLDSLFVLALFVAIVVLVAVLFFRQDSSGRVDIKAPYDVPAGPLLIPIASLALAIVLAFGEMLAVFHLLYSELGVVLGPGWTDVYVRLPALIFMGGVLIAAGALPLFAGFRAFMTQLAQRWVPQGPPTVVAVIGAWFTIILTWGFFVGATPQLVQWLVVKPNEITYEIPYIARNIEFTRKAFQLDQIEERQFAADAELTPEAAADNAHLLSEVRLWDWRALDAVYKQFQEIRLY